MNQLPLSFACWDYDRVRSLTDGSIEVKGIELNWINLAVEETFWRMMRHQEFDVSELSLSSFLIAADRGFPKFKAIPVFMSRMFRHSGVYINIHAGINKPEDLKGKRVGIPEYQLTACVWIRGILEDEYEVSPADVTWLTGGEETPGRIEKVALDLPPEITIKPIGEEQTLNEMLESGEIDAIVAPRAPSSFLKGSPNVKRLFEDCVAVEKEYYKKTGIFPIMPVVAIKEEILEQHPWVAMNLYQAFIQAEQKVYDGFNQTAALKVTLPWLVPEVEETKRRMGEDFWPYGFEQNRPTLEAVTEYAFKQGLTKKHLNIDDLFVKSTMEEFII